MTLNSSTKLDRLRELTKRIFCDNSQTTVVKMKCPICEKGILEKEKSKESMFGVLLGEFPAEICSFCKESFTDKKTTQEIQEAAKRKGVWGLGIKTKITRSGNSLAVRIPQKIAVFLGLKEGKEAYIHPEKDKLVIESL